MIKEFIAWLVGVIEDFPIPYEVKNLYFCLHKENNFYFYLSFGGNDFDCQKRLLNFQYYPLDAQFFDVHTYNKTFGLLDLRILITKAIKHKQLSTFFSGKKIFYGVYGSEEIYKLD